MGELFKADVATAALQGLPGVKRVFLQGRNAAISTSAETIWQPGATYAQLTTAAAHEVVSSSANDAAAGTGARTVVIEGLIAGYVEASETVTLNGTTAVATVNSYIAINAMRVATAGSGNVNAGTIDCRTVSGSVVKRRIGTDVGSTQDASFIYTVPAGKVAVLKSVFWSATGATGEVSVFIRSYDSNGLFRDLCRSSCGLNATSISVSQGMLELGAGLAFTAGQLIEGRAITSAGAGDLNATADLLVIDRILSGW
jgi:hypothetical protein